MIPYSNPWRWRSRRELFNDCYRHFKAAANVAVHRVEVAFGDRPHEVAGDDPLDTQLRTRDEMWLKENSINLVTSRLQSIGSTRDTPMAIFISPGTIGPQAIHLLQHYDFVQLFSTYADLTGETATSWQGHGPIASIRHSRGTFSTRKSFSPAQSATR